MRNSSMSKQKKAYGDISSLALHICAMCFMLCDHLWATMIPGQSWMSWLGRLAFPIFAFLIVEGYFYTHNYKNYLKRLLIFALLAEIPFNLMYTASGVFPFYQNVLWTFLLALLCMKSIDKLRECMKLWVFYPMAVLVVGVFAILARLAMTDYYSYGVLTVMVFYFFRGSNWWCRLGQALGLIYINWYLISGMTVPFDLFGVQWEFPQQGVAVFSLLLIWGYQGRQGPHNKWIQYALYAFYPIHMLILGWLSM